MLFLFLKFNLVVLVNLLILHPILGITKNPKMKLQEENFIKLNKTGVKM